MAFPGWRFDRIQTKRKTRGIQPGGALSTSSPSLNRTVEVLMGMGMARTCPAMGSTQWMGSEVTRYSRQMRGRMGWMLHDSSRRKGQGTLAAK